jgi:uncharacterized protein
VKEEKHRKDVVRYWWGKAEESLLSAERELNAYSLSFAMNRIYYSAFYAVSSALLDRRISFKKHSAVRSNFHREFIKSHLLDIGWGKFYDRLFEDRQEGDNIALIEFDVEYVKNQLKKCEDFLNALKPLISTLKNTL